jgi:oligopeptidase A
MNPLLDFSGLPRFAQVRPEHVTPAVDELLAENRDLLTRLVAPETPATWDAFVRPLEDANERLGRAWGVVAHLHGVLDTPPLREAYNASLPKITQYWTELGQNLALFDKYRALAASPAFAALDRAQKKIVENALRDFRLGGAELPDAEKRRFAEIMDELAAANAKFSENVLDATNAFSLHVEDRADLAGLPDDALEAARAAAEKDGKPGWKFTLQAPSYLPVMQYADNRGLRETMYRASATRASEFGPPALDNTPLIGKILRLRKEAAALLGFANHAEVSLVPKMAESPAQVLAFLEDLAAKAKPYARRDWDELQAFARDQLGLERLEAWDVAWASEKLRMERYAFSDNEVKQYFPEPKVLAGMFRVVESIYGVRIGEDAAEVWDPTVRFFRIADRSGRLIGRFYLDPYARDTKRGGAWMDDVIVRRRQGDDVQTPVAHLVCNFPSPVGGKPALLTHDDVITLFHEFGHGLHLLLTEVDHLGVSGIRGVEWDAVELPSQFMENFCWEWDVLAHMTAHVDTGAPLPRALFDKMIAAKNFQAGMQMVRQLEFSLFDMHVHYDFDPDGGSTYLQLLDDVRARVAVNFPPPYNRFPNSFSHIFAGGYDAGYYSYKWAEVLSADAYGAFEEARDRAGVLDPATGARFREEILAVGGSRPAMESFRAFRGREPMVDALLRHNGMVSPAAA